MVVVALDWNSAQNINKKVQKQEKSSKMKRDVGIYGVPRSTQTTWTRKEKSDGKYTKASPYMFTLLWKDVGMDEALYIHYHFYPSLFVYFLARHSYIAFHDISFLL